MKTPAIPLEEGIAIDAAAKEVVSPLVDSIAAASWEPPARFTPQTISIKKLAQRYTMDALGALVEVIHDKSSPAAAKVAAATQILDRGYGKPKQYVDLEGEVVTLSLADLLARRLAEVAGMRASQEDAQEAQFEPVDPQDAHG